MSHNVEQLRYTLVSEGSSDKILMPILNWLLRENGVTEAIQGEWADLGEASIAEQISLTVKVREALRLYPCDLLFIHRDADRATRENRVAEIERAMVTAMGSDARLPVVCVVPVRMQEAWLLFDEAAIRYAAGNRNGRIPLNLPSLIQLESLPDPKTELYRRLKLVSDLRGRRLKRFRANQRVHRISWSIDDFSPLRNLSAFAALEQDIQRIVGEQGWDRE